MGTRQIFSITPSLQRGTLVLSDYLQDCVTVSMAEKNQHNWHPFLLTRRRRKKLCLPSSKKKKYI